MSREPPRALTADPAVGDTVEVETGSAAHGGFSVARHEGRVVFVRHALPGERVRALVTEVASDRRYLRADAVEVLAPSPDRVEPPCPYAGPGRCGGCDLQHVALPAQRTWKAAVVREQLSRLAHLDLDVPVEPVAGDLGGLGWRTRLELVAGEDGRPGLRSHRSHDVVAVDRCAIATDRVNAMLPGLPTSPAGTAYDVVDPSVGEPVVTIVPSQDKPPTVTEGVGDRTFEVSARGFWQVHPGAARTFVDIVLGMLGPRPGERALDLYAGVGLFAAFLADRVGPTGAVVAVESEATACEHAVSNVASLGNVVILRSRVDDSFGLPRRDRGPRRRTARRPTRHPLMPPSADVVVIDPPRAGAGRAVLKEVTALEPRALAYVACDPAALARDTAYLLGMGWRLREVRALDAFPMTHHVECIAHFDRDILTSR